MVNWISLATPAEVDELVQQSETIPCLIFKHSTRCSISSFAKHRLEQDWELPSNTVEPFFLDLIANRETSNYVADALGIEHESPQVLIVHRGRVIYHASHLAIALDEIREQLMAVS